MTLTAAEIMTIRFHTLTSDTPVNEAVILFEKASAEEGRRVFGMMVIDDDGHLEGMISMYDILLYLRPKHTHIWGVMEDIDITGLVHSVCAKTKSIRVGDIMTPDVVTVSPETHLFMILDIMIKKHIRRLPVVDNGSVLGIVYISDLFNTFVDHCRVRQGER